MEKCSMDFGKKEHVLNYACQLYQLSRPNKVGAVMALIRETGWLIDGPNIPGRPFWVMRHRTPLLT